MLSTDSNMGFCKRCMVLRKTNKKINKLLGIFLTCVILTSKSDPVLPGFWNDFLTTSFWKPRFSRFAFSNMSHISDDEGLKLAGSFTFIWFWDHRLVSFSLLFSLLFKEYLNSFASLNICLKTKFCVRLQWDNWWAKSNHV